MGPVDHPGTRPECLPDSIFDHVEMGARKTDGVAVSHAACENNDLSPAVNHHFRPRNGPLSWATATRYEPHDLDRTRLFKGARAGGGYLEIGDARAHVLSLATSNNSCFHRLRPYPFRVKRRRVVVKP